MGAVSNRLIRPCGAAAKQASRRWRNWPRGCLGEGCPRQREEQVPGTETEVPG